jgi:hypothetical protein
VDSDLEELGDRIGRVVEALLARCRERGHVLSTRRHEVCRLRPAALE